MKIALYFILITTGYSCQTLTLAKAGVRNPKVETIFSQRKFLNEMHIDDSINMHLSFDALIPAISNEFSPTSVYVFDKNGSCLKLPGGTNKCAPEPLFFINDLQLNKIYQKDNMFTLDSLFNWTLAADGNKTRRPADAADYYVFVTWTVWTGKKVFLSDVVPTIKAATENKNVKIKLWLLNLDMQESWGQENLKKVSFTKTSMNVKL